jgi:3-hydroxybutyryl-CoA dehydrogenase
MSEYSFVTAGVIGTGTMGPGIAVTLALGGLRTVILSRSAEGALASLQKARTQLGLLERQRIIDTATAARSSELIGSSTEFVEIVGAADLVIESTPENMDFKQQLFERMDWSARPEAVLATNTSSLSVTQIAARCRYPERVLTTHFWNPPFLMPLVEIVRGEKTSPEVAETVRRMLTRCGKTAVVVKKDRPGQLGNRLQHALWREAVNIVAEGIADAEDVDLAAKTGFGLRLPVYGIFEHADVVGLKMVLDIMNYISKDLYNEPKAPDLLHQLVASGELGATTGKGFYDWSKKDLGEVLRVRDQFVLDMVRNLGHRVPPPAADVVP